MDAQPSNRWGGSNSPPDCGALYWNRSSTRTRLICHAAWATANASRSALAVVSYKHALMLPCRNVGPWQCPHHCKCMLVPCTQGRRPAACSHLQRLCKHVVPLWLPCSCANGQMDSKIANDDDIAFQLFHPFRLIQATSFPIKMKPPQSNKSRSQINGSKSSFSKPNVIVTTLSLRGSRHCRLCRKCAAAWRCCRCHMSDGRHIKVHGLSLHLSS